MCACVRRRQTNGSGSSSASSATLPPLTLITTHPTHLSLSSSGCPLSGHGERPRRRWGDEGGGEGGKGGHPVGRVAPRDMSPPVWAAHIVCRSEASVAGVCRPGRRGSNLHYLVRLLPVCVCVCPSRRRDLTIAARRRANVRATACSLPPPAGCSVRAGLEMARGRQRFRDGRGAVRAKPSTMKASTDSLSCPSAAGV